MLAVPGVPGVPDVLGVSGVPGSPGVPRVQYSTVQYGSWYSTARTSAHSHFGSSVRSWLSAKVYSTPVHTVQYSTVLYLGDHERRTLPVRAAH